MLASNPQQLRPFFSLLKGKRLREVGCQRPLRAKGTTSPSRHGRHRVQSACTPPTAGTDHSLSPFLPRDTGQRTGREHARAHRRSAPGPHGADRTSPHATEPASGPDRCDRDTAPAGKRKDQAALCPLSTLAAARAAAASAGQRMEKTPLEHEREADALGHCCRLFVKGGRAGQQKRGPLPVTGIFLRGSRKGSCRRLRFRWGRRRGRGGPLWYGEEAQETQSRENGMALGLRRRVQW